MFGLDFSQIKRILGLEETRDNFDGLLPINQADYTRGFLMGGNWTLAYWVPRHLEIVRIAQLFEQVARKRDIPLKVFEAGCGKGLVAYLLAREGLRVHGVDCDSEAIDEAFEYEDFWWNERRNKKLRFTLGKIEQLMDEKDRLVFCSWPLPKDKKDKEYFIDAMAQNRPDMVVVVQSRLSARERAYTDLTKIGYKFELGWKSFGWRYFGDQLKNKDHNFHGLVEVYTKKNLKLKLRVPVREKKVEPYPWEKALPSVRVGKTHGFYKVRKGKFKR